MSRVKTGHNKPGEKVQLALLERAVCVFQESQKSIAKMLDSKPTTTTDHHPVLARTIRLLQKRAAKRTPPHEQSSSTDNSLEMEYESKTSFASSHNKVFGRHKELQQLLAIYEHIVSNSSPANSHLALVYGKSGVGKSALVRAFVKRLPKQAIFVDGKFDQLKTHAPYAALIKAANDLSRQALKRRDSKYILDRIQDELGPDLDLLGSILEALSSLAKKKTTIATSGQAFTRFKLLMRGFFRSIATPESPVVLFLDDLQWADVATMEVLQSLLTDKESAYVFFIFSYRQDEMNQQMLNDYILPKKEDDRVETTNVCVDNLDSTSLNKMVATVLRSSVDVTLPLSTMIIKKTQGNPFYALNFMDKLHADGMLNKTDDNDVWMWDVTTILQQTDVADNLADILEAKVLRLPERVRSILQLASFIGHDFSVNVLLTIVHEEQDMIESEYSFDLFDKTVIEKWILEALDLALKEGLLEESAGERTFKFSHDKIQHCLYKDLMPDDVERRLLHQRIGKLIWNTIRSQEAVEDWILFLAADNLNRGPKFVDDDNDRLELIELNMRASRLAATKAAFLVAVEYIRSATELALSDDNNNGFFESNHTLCMDLLRKAAEMEITMGCYEQSNAFAQEIHKRARVTEERFPAFMMEIQALGYQGELPAAMTLAFETLKLCGIKFPKKITSLTVIKEFIRIQLVVGRRTAKDLMELPRVTDVRLLFAMDLLGLVSDFAFAASGYEQDACVALGLRLAYLTFRYGLSDKTSPKAFLKYGLGLVFIGKFDISTSFGEAAMALAEKCEAPSGNIQLYGLGCMLLWKKEIQQVINGFMEGHHKALMEGATDSAYWGATGWMLSAFNFGVPLPQILAKAKQFCSEMEEYRSRTALLTNLPIYQMMLNLAGSDEMNHNPALLSGQAMDLDAVLNEVHATKSTLLLFAVVVCEVTVAYNFRNYDILQQKLSVLINIVSACDGYWSAPVSYTAVVWACFLLYRHTGDKKYKQLAKIHRRKVTKFAKSGHPIASPFRAMLVAGKRIYINDKKKMTTRTKETLEFVKTAMEEVQEKKIYWGISLLNEALTDLFLRQKESRVAVHFLEKAIECNKERGAHGKARYLEQRLATIRVE